MLKFQRVAALVTLAVVSPLLGLTARAETLRFAWPDGATAKVTARSHGRRVLPDKTIPWDMSSDFAMQIRRTGDRLVVSRSGFNGWKGTLPPSAGGGAERFTDMIPTFIVSADGKFIGIEGHEAARKLMNSSVEQSGGLNPVEGPLFKTFSSNAGIEAMARDHWSMLVPLWEQIELQPGASYELQSVAAVPQLGGGQIDITGEVGFVKEAPCGPGLAGRRCVHFGGETGPDKAQVTKIIESLLRRAGADAPKITAFDVRFKVDIVLDKATMLPQQLTLVRLNSVTFKIGDREGIVSEEINKTYTFDWVIPNPEPKK